MKASLVTNATRILSILPFAQAVTHSPTSPALLTAAALVNTPFIRRVAPGLSGLATIGLATVGIVSFVSSLKKGKSGHTSPSPELNRSSAT